MLIIKCVKCNRAFMVDKIPDSCPACKNHNAPDHEHDDPSFLKTMLRAITKFREKWYYVSDVHGWVKGEQIQWPERKLY